MELLVTQGWQELSQTCPIQGFLAPQGDHKASFRQETAGVLISKLYTKSSSCPCLSHAARSPWQGATCLEPSLRKCA